MKSPFKFLDAFTLSDKEVFFGRAKESKALYQHVHATSLVLVYGLSGTGKTSLVQCGLSQRFDGPDWFPFFIRRGDNINESTVDVLSKALVRPAADNELPTLVNAIFRHYLRPVYLIFDQFEELFTVRNVTSDNDESIINAKKEQEQFFESLHALLIRTEVPCKVLLIMREEFIGQLYEYERVVPTLFDFRLRVEPMTAGTIQDVVDKTFRRFGISSEPTVTEAITKNLLTGQATSQLAYLQVYMDRLWREAQEQADRQGNQLVDGEPVCISEATLQHTGDVSSVLNRYLDEQEQAIQTKLNLPDEAIVKVLDYFVTAEGTKQPMAYKLANEQLVVSKIEVPGLSVALLSNTLIELEKARLIRRDDSFLELAHDSLAGIIDQKRTAEQRLLNSLIQSFKVNYELYTRQGGLLNPQQVALYDQFRQKLVLEPIVVDYIEQSRAENKREEDALRTTNNKLKRQARMLVGFVAVVSGLGIMSGFLYLQSKENLNKANREKANLLLIDAETYMKSEDFGEAKGNINNATKLLPNSEIELREKASELTKDIETKIRIKNE
ncbi:ATP-binding protein [Spirosoma aerophilum]